MEEMLLDNGDNTITDKGTGLQWIQDHTIIPEFAKEATPTAIVEAIAGLNRQRYAGCENWRLPTRKELLSIVDITRFAPAINPIFKNIRSDIWYLTSDPVVVFPLLVWCVVFLRGDVNRGAVDELFFALPVRSIK